MVRNFFLVGLFYPQLYADCSRDYTVPLRANVLAFLSGSPECTISVGMAEAIEPRASSDKKSSIGDGWRCATAHDGLILQVDRGKSKFAHPAVPEDVPFLFVDVAVAVGIRDAKTGDVVSLRNFGGR